MDLDTLTLGDIKQLQSLMGGSTSNKPSLGSHLIGKYVIVRTRNEGINSGYITALDDTGIVLKDARRFYYHKPKDKAQSWYEGIANSGLHKDSKVSSAVSEKVIVEDYSITVCSADGQKSIEGFASHEQN